MATFESPIHQQTINCKTVSFDDPENQTSDENKNDVLPQETFVSAENNSVFRRFGNGQPAGFAKPRMTASVLNGTEEWNRGQRLSRTRKKAEER